LGFRLHAGGDPISGHDTSLKKEYGRVEVAVLNTDLLPNSIDTVIIGDRLFSLPIQVEGLEANEEHNNQMEVNDGDSGAANSSAGNNGEGRDDGPKEGNASQATERDSGNAPQQSHISNADKCSEGSHGSGRDQVEGNKKIHSGNSLNLNQTCKATIPLTHSGAKNNTFCADREVHDSLGMANS
jgi:hypothetical protein